MSLPPAELLATVRHLEGAADCGEQPAASPLARMWDLAVPAAVAAEALFGFLASVTIDDADAGTVAALDAATALLVHTGEQARRLRAEIGLGGADSPEGC